MPQELTHEPTAEREEQRIYCTPGDQNTKVQTYS